MKVELKQIKGNDWEVADVARVSYGKESDNYSEDQNIKLIKYLAKHGHSSPFRHVSLQFRIKCPIYVERQLFKHHVGVSVNSISGRYVDFSDSYYYIEQFRKQSKDSKQGSGEDLDGSDNREALRIQSNLVQYCKEAYQKLLDLSISKEQARSILPLSLETEFIWTGSLQAFIHLCHLRLKKDTQKETRDIVEEMLSQVKKDGSVKYSLEAYNL